MPRGSDRIDYPRRLLSEERAAAYVGASRGTFRAEVARGVYPPPIRRGRRVLWDVRAIDQAIDRLSDLSVQSPSTSLGEIEWDALK